MSGKFKYVVDGNYTPYGLDKGLALIELVESFGSDIHCNGRYFHCKQIWSEGGPGIYNCGPRHFAFWFHRKKDAKRFADALGYEVETLENWESRRGKYDISPYEFKFKTFMNREWKNPYADFPYPMQDF